MRQDQAEWSGRDPVSGILQILRGQEKNVWTRSDAIVACRRQARSVTGPDARSQQRRTWTEGLRVWDHQQSNSFARALGRANLHGSSLPKTAPFHAVPAESHLPTVQLVPLRDPAFLIFNFLSFVPGTCILQGRKALENMWSGLPEKCLHAATLQDYTHRRKQSTEKRG